jgi:hypothetical protein
MNTLRRSPWTIRGRHAVSRTAPSIQLSPVSLLAVSLFRHHLNGHSSRWASLCGDVTRCQAGAGDHYDIKLPCHLMLTKLAGLAAPTVLSHVDTLVEPLEKTLLTKLKTDAVKQVYKSLRCATPTFLAPVRWID